MSGVFEIVGALNMPHRRFLLFISVVNEMKQGDLGRKQLRAYLTLGIGLVKMRKDPCGETSLVALVLDQVGANESVN